MTINLRSARGRAGLASRIDPYWEPLGDGLSVGLYVGARGQAWKARAPGTGKQRWRKVTLGKLDTMTYTEAVKAAHAWAGETVGDRADTHQTAATVAVACTAWIDTKEKTAGTIASDKARAGWGRYVACIKAFFGADTELSEITTAQCEAFRDRPADRGGKRSAATGDRDLAAAKAIFAAGAKATGYAGPRNWEAAAKRGQKAISIEHADRDFNQLGGRALTVDEVKAIIDAAEDPAFGDFMRAMFLTCQRPQALRMADIRDFDRAGAKLRLRREERQQERRCDDRSIRGRC